MSKPLVKYADLGFCVVGCPASVIPLNHPDPRVRNYRWATTSKVQSLTWTPYGPRFETTHSIYVPEDGTEERLTIAREATA